LSLFREKLSFLKITHIPKVEWSSNTPFNIQPRLITIFYLILGLTLFGLGEALLIISSLGVTPWTVLAEGISLKLKISVGLATFFVSISILILWIPLKQKLGLGTISNAIVIASTIDLFVYLIPETSSFFISILYLFLGIFLVGLGSGLYLTTNLGPGTRDGLMKGVSENFNKPISLVRLIIETTVVILGWLLGGTVGIGTVMFAIFIGPLISMALSLIRKIYK
tara:strand:- start:2676 stop:3347 length:672 start_codon:yes stop_codon:yes gene_type:complete